MEHKSNGLWWKILIVLTFIISISCLYILIFNKSTVDEILPKYKYETRLIELDNTNTIEYFKGEVIDYLCDEGVEARVLYGDKSQFYASTWEGTTGINKGFIGRCMIKTREIK